MELLRVSLRVWVGAAAFGSGLGSAGAGAVSVALPWGAVECSALAFSAAGPAACSAGRWVGSTSTMTMKGMPYKSWHACWMESTI